MSLISAIGGALSGAIGATERFSNSANNVANQRSIAAPNAPLVPNGTPEPQTDAAGNPLFRPSRTQNVDLSNGGVRTSTLLANPVSIQEYQPDASDADADGLVNRPAVSAETEVVDQLSARRALEANLATVRTADELLEEIIDIIR